MDRNFPRFNQSPGPERRPSYFTSLVSPSECGRLSNVSLNRHTELEGRVQLLNVWNPYVVTNHVTETKDNSSTIAAAAAGLEFKTQATPSDNDDIVITSIRTQTLAAGRMYRYSCRLKVSSAANLGFIAGFVTSGGTEYFTAAPTDGFYFIKAKNAATLTFRVIENGNAAVDTTTFVQTLGSAATALSLVDDTDIVLEIEVYFNGSTTTRGKVIINGLETNLSSTVATALYTMLNTTAPTLVGHLGFRVNSTTQRTGTVQYCWAECDRA